MSLCTSRELSVTVTLRSFALDDLYDIRDGVWETNIVMQVLPSAPWTGCPDQRRSSSSAKIERILACTFNLVIPFLIKTHRRLGDLRLEYWCPGCRCPSWAKDSKEGCLEASCIPSICCIVSEWIMCLGVSVCFHVCIYCRVGERVDGY